MLEKSETETINRESLERFYRFCFQARRDLIDHAGDMESALILMVVDWANTTESTADISMISDITEISRPTVRRKIGLLEEKGVVRVERTANRTLVHPCQDNMRSYMRTIRKTMRAFLATANQVKENFDPEADKSGC